MNKKLFDLFQTEEYKRGSGGVLYIKGEEYSYIFSHEFSNKDFASKLQDILDEGNKENIYFVVEQSKQLHVMSYSRQKILFEAASDTFNDKTTPN